MKREGEEVVIELESRLYDLECVDSLVSASNQNPNLEGLG